MDFRPSNQSLPPTNTSELSTINLEHYSDVDEALDCGEKSRGESDRNGDQDGRDFGNSSAEGGIGAVEVNHGGESCNEWRDSTGDDGGMVNNIQNGGLEVNDDGLKKKRRRYGRNKSLSRKKYRGDAKTVSSNAAKAAFIRPVSEGTTSSGTKKQNTIQLKMKSLRNQKNYEVQKHQQTKASVAGLKHKIEQLSSQCKSHEDFNAQQSIEIAKAKVETEKSKQILEKRTERWSMWREKMEEVTRKLKKSAWRRINALQKKHQTELVREHSIQYKMERNHVKAVVALQDEMESVRRDAEKEIGKLTDERDNALAVKENAMSLQNAAIRDAAWQARIEERHHCSRIVEKNKGKTRNLSLKMTELTNRTISAEKEKRIAVQQAKQSTSRSRSVIEITDTLKSRVHQLEKELLIERSANNDLQMKLEECEMEIEKANGAVPIKEVCKVREGGRGNASWPFFIWELIIEQLVNGTPPSSVNSNIVSLIRTFSPTTKISELPSIWTIRRARTVLLVIVQTLAVYGIAKAKKWEQLFTDGTSRRQVSFQDLIISVEEDELFKPLLISSCIFPEDERSETVCKAIIDTLIDKSKLLDQWMTVHESMFPNHQHDIPSGSDIHLSKLQYGLITTDTCNSARLLSRLLADKVKSAVEQKMGNLDGSNVIVLTQDCHHHLRNVWIEAVNKRLSSYLNEVLASDLSNIDFRLRVSTMFDAVLRAVDKEFSLPANYPKGHGDMFLHWLRHHHPGALLVPVERTAGSRQDMAAEGAAAVYWNRRYYVEFLDESLRSVRGNILQENLFIVLTSVEMVALCRVMAILYFKIGMPLRWLAGNTHTLGQVGYDWSTRSMGKAIDALHDALIQIESNGNLYLDEDFMNSIFNKIYTDDNNNSIPLQPLEDAMKYQYEIRQTPAVDGSKVLPFDRLNAELFYPTREENVATNEMVKVMACEVAECMLDELRDPKKATSDYLSSAGGKFSWGKTTEDEHYACLGKMATNDPAESTFASLTRQLQCFGRVLGVHASAIGQARVNGDFDCKVIHGCDGAYHRLSQNMRQSLMRFALSTAPVVRKAEKTALDKQREAKKQKQEFLRQKKMIAMQKEYVNALTYIDMFHSPACWKTVAEAKRLFRSLSSNASKLEAVKEQIRIRVVGFGWKDLHHPWSEGGVAHSPETLLKHLVEVIIPEQQKREVPDEPKMVLPSRKLTPQLGTKTPDVEALEIRYENEKKNAVVEAVRMREELEAQGIADRHEMLQPQRPQVDENLIGVEIEQLWMFVEEDGTTVAQWCQGIVVGVKTRNKVHIKWNENCLREGDAPVTEEALMKSKYNKHVEGGWRISLD